VTRDALIRELGSKGKAVSAKAGGRRLHLLDAAKCARREGDLWLATELGREVAANLGDAGLDGLSEPVAAAYAIIAASPRGVTRDVLVRKLRKQGERKASAKSAGQRLRLLKAAGLVRCEGDTWSANERKAEGPAHDA
jgi:hypothetical protein